MPLVWLVLAAPLTGVCGGSVGECSRVNGCECLTDCLTGVLLAVSINGC